QDFEGTESPSGDHQARNQKMRAAAGEAFSRASDTARDAGAKAKRAAEGAASSLTDSVMGLLNRQVGASADAAGRFASAMKSAAQGMERGNPMLADLGRGLANNGDAYAVAVEKSDRRAADQSSFRLYPQTARAGLRVGRRRG